MFESENVKYMWLNDLFWGIRNTSVRALSACGQSLQKNPGRGQTPPSPNSGNTCILGTFGTVTPPFGQVFFLQLTRSLAETSVFAQGLVLEPPRKSRRNLLKPWSFWKLLKKNFVFQRPVQHGDDPANYFDNAVTKMQLFNINKQMQKN